MSKNKGFTLIELLIVIGIIGLIAGAILVAVDPVKRIQDSRNAKRWSEINGILNALLTKQVDNKAIYDGETGALIVTDANLSQVIVRNHAGIDCDTPATAPLCPEVTLSTANGTPCVANLSGLVPDFIAELPFDPTTTVPTTGPDIDDDNTGYYIHRTAGNRIEIGSCWPDQGATIKVKR